MRRSITYSPLSFISDVLPRPETIRDCPALNPPLDLRHELDAMVARVLHPGHAGPLNVPLASERDLRHLAGIVW